MPRTTEPAAAMDITQKTSRYASIIACWPTTAPIDLIDTFAAINFTYA